MSVDSHKGKRITFVMGAGASLPFIAHCDMGLSTEYLTEQLSNRNRWVGIYDEFKEHIPEEEYPDLNFNISVDDILSVIEKLKAANELEIRSRVREQVSVPLPEKPDDVYGIGRMNFEYVLYLLDKICNCLYDGRNNIDNLLCNLWMDADAQMQQFQLRKGWNYVPYLAREVVVKAILDLWESCEKRKAIEDNREFFASVLEKFESASIYSLNYDPLLHEATRGIRVRGFKTRGEVQDEVEKVFETGFSEGGEFNPKKFYLNDNVIAFLHGHVGFLPEGGKDNMRFDDTYAKAQKRRISGVASGQVGYYRRGPKGVHYNTFLTSGLEKYESLYDNPYACYFHRFAEDVIESKHIVFIGSSLGDYHVNLFAASAWRLANGYAEEPRDLLRLRKPMVGPKKVTIVTRDQAKEGFKEFLFTSDIGRALFGFSRENIGWSKDRADSALKMNGYANTNQGLCVYLKGTKEFFSDMWRIEGMW